MHKNFRSSDKGWGSGYLAAFFWGQRASSGLLMGFLSRHHVQTP